MLAYIGQWFLLMVFAVPKSTCNPFLVCRSFPIFWFSKNYEKPHASESCQNTDAIPLKAAPIFDDYLPSENTRKLRYEMIFWIRINIIDQKLVFKVLLYLKHNLQIRNCSYQLSQFPFIPLLFISHQYWFPELPSVGTGSTFTNGITICIISYYY